MIQPLVNIDNPNTGNGDPLRDGGVKINQNFIELFDRTSNSVPFEVIQVPVDFTITNEIDRLVDGLNAMNQRVINPRTAYILVTNRVVSSGASTFQDTVISQTNYALLNKIEPITTVAGNQIQYNNVTIGAGGNFTFTTANLSIHRLSQNTVNVTNGIVTGANSIDLGVIGAVPVEAAVNALTPKVPVGAGGVFILSNNGTDDQIHLYIGNEPCLGVGVTTTANDFVLLDGNDPGVASSDYVAIRVFGNVFQLRKAPANNDPTKLSELEAGDFILNGVDDTGGEFWGSAQFQGIDPVADRDNRLSWNILLRSKI